jgi:hypothetical protein
MEEITWTKITDSVKSLPPQGQWILIALPREGGVVVEACYDGIHLKSRVHVFHMRDGMTFYGSEYRGKVIAWAYMPRYPKDLE